MGRREGEERRRKSQKESEGVKIHKSDMLRGSRVGLLSVNKEEYSKYDI